MSLHLIFPSTNKSHRHFHYFLKFLKKRFLLFFLAFAFSLFTNPLYAWIYPEHRDIAILAIQKLNPTYRALLDKLWMQARTGHTSRLTEFVIDPTQSIKPTQLDFAAWPAIAGDHSCSPAGMLSTVLETDWILKVADVAAQLKIDIANSKDHAQHVNALRLSDMRFQRVDPEYATRAGSNNVHFLLARMDSKETIASYIESCLKEKTPLNALGAYAYFHTSAMIKLDRLNKEKLSEEQQAALALSALADEAFALHFLEDVFAAGHIAGTWGDASLRKGTHDYYNEKGLEKTTWEGKPSVHMGDAFMQPDDAEFASEAVIMSLEQLLKVASGELQIEYKTDDLIMANTPDSFNVCKNNFMPARNYFEKMLATIFIKTPVPGLSTGFGELPRFRAELGTFIGFSGSLNGSKLFSGFGKSQTNGGFQGGLEANIRFGMGLDGVLNQSGDGLIFIQAGWRQDAATTNKFTNTDPNLPTYSIFSSISGRSAYNLRLRLPFWLIPGDLLVAGPFLLLLSPQTIQKMAVEASNGGLIPWQAGLATKFGRFQFILGREVGVSFYGLTSPKDVIIVPHLNKNVLLQYKSTRFDFPVVEYRPLRTFSQEQSSSLMIQVNVGLDIPHGANVLSPVGQPAPELRKIWSVGLRILFNWRSYF